MPRSAAAAFDRSVEADLSAFRRTYRGRRVLVTGGLGFIGSNLARALVGLGARVTLLDNLFPNYGGNRRNIAGLGRAVRVVIGDVRDRTILPRLVRGQDFLFNLAGQTSHMDSMVDPDTDLEINCRAQLSILEACRRHNPGIRVVFASTRQIYGRPDYLPVDERHPARPVDVNGINKLAGEEYHLLYSAVHGIRSTVLRLTNTIGPRMRVKDARQTFVGVWVSAALRGRPFEVWGGRQLRDFTYVDDAVEAFLLAAARPAAVGRVYNLGGVGRISLRALADLVAELTAEGEARPPDAAIVTAKGRARPLGAPWVGGTPRSPALPPFRVRSFPADRRKIDVGDFYADDRRIRRELGWRPRTDISTALVRTIEFYRRELEHYL